MLTGHPPFDWAIQDIQRKADEALRRCDEIHTLRSNVDSLERANRELSSEVNGLRSQLQTNQDAIIQLQAQIVDLIEATK